MKVFCKLKSLLSAVWAAMGACIGLYDRHITEPAFSIASLTEPELDRLTASMATLEMTSMDWPPWTAGLTYNQVETLRELQKVYLELNRYRANAGNE